MRCFFGSAVVVVAAAMASAVHAQLPQPVFHVPFDGSTDAQQGGGKREPLTAQSLTYSPGVSAQAVAISPSSLLEYAVDGNLVQERGTVSMWFKPNWRIADMTSDAKDWHCLFSQRLPDGKERIGSGMLWFWFWGSSYRGDLSDAADQYKTAGAQGLDPTTWVHVAFTWDVDRGSRLYMNGVEVGNAGDGNSPLDVKKGKDFSALKNRFTSFWVGSQGGMARADGLIDEFRIYDRALAPAEITQDMALVSPMRLDCLNSFVMEAMPTKARWRLTNGSAAPADVAHAWKLARSGGDTVAQGQIPTGTLPAGQGREFTADLPALPKGEYKLIVEPSRGVQRSAAVWVMGKENPWLKAAGKVQSTPVETIDLVKGISPERIVVRGESTQGTLAGRSYYELGAKKNDRIAIRLRLPEAGVPYLVEWDYPDDKLRTMEMVAQVASTASWDEYAMQTGVFCGDEYPNSNQTLTHRSILWARSTDTVLIFMTARANAPAAMSELRVSRVTGGLPDAAVRDAHPVNGWTRTVGIHFEDPAIGYDFGASGQLMPHYEQTLDRLVAYMKYSGQNLLSYPAVWYHGRMGTAYQPRPHEDDYISAILTKFEANGLGFTPTINLHNIPLPDDVLINEKTFADGSLHASPVMILATGKPNPGGFHGSPPNFNPLHPAVRRYIDQQIDDLLQRYGSSPAFKGIVLHLTKHTIPWFGTLEAGYNDYCIEAFEKDTGTRVDVDRQNPLRGKLYHDWLVANAREQWVAWRCRQIAKWYRAMADRISARRPDLKLTLLSYNPTVTDFARDPRYGTPEFAMTIDRESGLDPKLYADATNIILSQSVYPADYRWSGSDLGKARAAVREEHMQPGTYAPIAAVPLPWVNMHDRYFEDGIGGSKWWGRVDPLKADWLKEVPWRVSTLNPNHRYFLEHYVLPLRYTDVLGYTKGGFLIGTLGVEEPLVAFSKAFRALPAARFSDLPGSTDTVKARVLKSPDGAWFYAVNTWREPVTVTITFDRAPGTIIDLSTGAPAPANHRVQLEPYQLLSFKASGGVPTGVSCQPRAQ